MIDIKLIRKDPEFIKQMIRNRQMNMDELIDRVIEIDKKRRALLGSADANKAEQNRASKEIPKIKAQGGDVSSLLEEMNELKAQIKKIDTEISALDAEQSSIMLRIPNVPSETVPVGKSDADNPVVRKWGEPRTFDFEAKPHWELGDSLQILDPQRAGKVTGARFHFYKGLGARLERSVINFYLDSHTSNGYTEVFPPYMVNRASMTGTGQLPKFEEDAFKLANEDYFLIPTAEVPVTNLHRDEILDGSKLPIKYCAYSACFRAEAGSAGRDTRGLIRQHQFNKVELVKFADPETSYQELESLTNDAETLLQKLGLAYRVVCLCTGDMGFSSAKTYDIEVWLPSYNRYCEISSCSNFEDFQARRASIRFKKSPTDKAQFVHTLNGSGLAIGRTVAAIIENYQNADGSITVPEVLRKYMGTDVIRGQNI